MAFFAILNARIQKLIIDQLTEKQATELNTVIKVEASKINFFNRLQFKNLYIEDQKGDTLVYSERLTMNYRLRIFNRNKRQFHFKRSVFHNAIFNLYQENDTLNVDFFIDYIKANKDTLKSPISIKIDKFLMDNSRFSYHDRQELPVYEKLDLNHLEFSNLNFTFKNFSVRADTLGFDISSMQLTDQCGLKIKNLKSKFEFHQTFIHFTMPEIQMNKSKFWCTQLTMTFQDLKSIANGQFPQNAFLDIPITESEIYFSDLAFINPNFNGVADKMYLSTHLTGYINNLKLDNTRILYGNTTYLKGDFDFTGLPNIKETFMFFEIKTLETSFSDIASLKKYGTRLIKLPDHFNESGLIKYHGNFTGFLNDFVTYGTVTSGFGTFSTDMSLRPDSLKNIAYNGNIKSKKLNLGKILNDTNYLGDCGFNLNISGTKYRKQGVLIYTQGILSYLNFNDYPVQNIRLNGILSNKKYNGVIVVNDQYLDLGFNGLVNFADSVNHYKFSSNVNYANLYKLGLVADDPNYSVSFKLEANAEGNSVENANGDILLRDAVFNRTGQSLNIDQLYLYTKNKLDSNELYLESDFLDISLLGSYQVGEISNSFQQFFGKYITALNDTNHIDPSLSKFESTFSLNIDLKNTSPITSFFIPELSIASNTTLDAHFYPNSQMFNMILQSDRIKYKSLDWKNMYLNSVSNDTVFILESGSKYLKINHQFTFDNYTMLSQVQKDTVGLELRWNNWDTLVNKGNLALNFFIERNDTSNLLSYHLFSDPSTIIIGDSLWLVDDLYANYHNHVLQVNHFNLHHDKQSIKINGVYSQNLDDSIRFNFQNYNLSNLNKLTENSDLIMEGKLNGFASLSKNTKQFKFISDLKADNLILNRKKLGDLNIYSSWNDEEKSVDMTTSLFSEALNTLNLSGRYFPFNEEKTSFELTFDRFNINNFNPYIDDIFSNVSGLVSGSLNIDGKLSAPEFNGELEMRNCAILVDYLQTAYSFSETIKCKNNAFIFDRVMVFDKDGNNAVLYGTIQVPQIKEMIFNITAQLNNFLCLNTSFEQNEYYYGTAYTTGILKFTGDKKNMNFDIAAGTNRNTRLYIPLTNESNISDYNFITFKPAITDTIEQVVNPTQQTNKTKSKINLNFDMQITPEAEVQLIFDSKIGDIIKTHGNGDLKLEIDNLGKFNMYGDYIISSGDYLFTLKNVINKHFTIKPGGEITWEGKPNDADMNIEAVYSTKPSIPPSFLSYGSAQDGFNQKIQTDCIITLTGLLKSPEVQTSIEFPRANENLRTLLEGQLNNQEKINTQFLWLLVLNSFMVEEENTTFGAGAVTRASGLTATTELFSNQLSNWLSQLSNRVDIDISYQKGELDNLGTDEFGLAVSTQMLNERVNISVGGNYTSQYKDAEQQNAIVGDFDMDVKLNKSGKLRFKAFNHYNNEYFTTYDNTYTQGIGLFYQEDFNSVNELFSRYWNKIFNKEKNTEPEN